MEAAKLSQKIKDFAFNEGQEYEIKAIEIKGDEVIINPSKGKSGSVTEIKGNVIEKAKDMADGKVKKSKPSTKRSTSK